MDRQSNIISMSSKNNGRSSSPMSTAGSSSTTTTNDDVSRKLMPPPPVPIKSDSLSNSTKTSRIVFVVDKSKLKDLGIQSKINSAMSKMNSSEYKKKFFLIKVL